MQCLPQRLFLLRGQAIAAKTSRVWQPLRRPATASPHKLSSYNTAHLSVVISFPKVSQISLIRLNGNLTTVFSIALSFNRRRMPYPLTFLFRGGSTELLPRHRSATSVLRFSIPRLTRQLSKAQYRHVLTRSTVLEAFVSILAL